ncbi:MAG: acyl-CoA dehydratase activase-related protein [Oscillospiraceae bacterium]|nr:acyl-CoA dehydratase activase-related protein [Oscillospiraceae bacterium]
MQTLGINIGSSSLKMVLIENGGIIWSAVRSHEGNYEKVAVNLLREGNIAPGTPTLITGGEGRYIFNVSGILEPICVEAAVNSLKSDGGKADAAGAYDAVVSMGGEDLILYSLNQGKIVNSFSGNKCASGTGEFFKQQLSRMDMTLDDIHSIPATAKVYPISTRCSVFMKSDCTHKLNKREAEKGDIVLSLSDVMAVKVVDFLERAKIRKGRVILTGGLTQNGHIVRFIKEKAPGIEFIIPESAPIFEALGAAVLASKLGSPLPKTDKLMKPVEIRFETLPPLSDFEHKVRVFEKQEGKVKKEGRYILGVDGGSTTTKACLVDIDTFEVAASHYGRTHGDPVKALKECLRVISDKVIGDTGAKDIKGLDIRFACVTGSAREILGVFLDTRGVYNEIIAHAMGAAYFDAEVETIFEIGGQDAKYVLLKNCVPIDYAMNEACSAGTGSFLEEVAAGDLSIKSDKDIGPIALKADAPLKFGEHCSAFINSGIRKAIGQSASRENITAGIVCSIVANYLNRVVGNRTIGGKVFLQGGVAKNPAVPAAFAMLLGKEILVPPSPELMGCFGVALLGKQKVEAGLLAEKRVDIDELLARDIIYDSIFKCGACENLCPIQVLIINDQKIMFGGRCNKYANIRKDKSDENGQSGRVFDYVEKREKLLFEEFAPPAYADDQADGERPDCVTAPPRDFTVHIPRALSVHTLYPLYAWFFYKLGIKTVLSEEIPREGAARCESGYCYPAEIAHGAVQDCINKNADYILLPHFRDMQSYEADVHANFCPLTQGLPYYIEKAFPDVDKEKWLPLVVSFKFGYEKALELFTQMGDKLKIGKDEVKAAFDIALSKQNEYFKAAKNLGIKALEDAKNADRPVIALLGRPYNAFTPEANMGIPRKFTTRGYSIIPFDILPFEDEVIFPNMYWYYGQEDVKSAKLLKNEDNIYLAYITNFSCAPDSFILHYIKWIMGQKPFLVLELDSHSADAGIDTRIEAFLDVIDGYRREKAELEAERYDNGWKFVSEEKANGEFDLRVDNNKTGERVQIRNNKRVKVLLSNMGEISTEYIGAALRGQGVGTVVLPIATAKTVMAARAHASGKECVPSHLVLGSALEFISSDKYRKDELYLLFVPITTGPCRTGQYYVYYENLFRDMRLENIVVFTLSANNSYGELGGSFSKDVWKGAVLADYLKDMKNTLKTIAEDEKTAIKEFDNAWRKLLGVFEHNPKDIFKELKLAADDIKKIPQKMKITQCPKVIVVGEIYVRRDDFAVGELTDLMSRRGIVVKVAGIAEWIYYLDFVRDYELNKKLKLRRRGTRIFSKPWLELKKLGVEKWWKRSVEKKIISILSPTGLIPETPHDMDIIMKYTNEHFLNLELQSEIAVSTGSAAAALDAGYSGVVNIGPFACLIGRVIEGIFTPWARERDYPFLSVEVDGNVLPPNIVNKLNIFMLNVLRHKGSGDLSGLVDDA